MRWYLKQLFPLLLVLQAQTAFAVDSYRYMHVTFNTLWYGFIALLAVILLPFVLMAVLAWRFSGKRAAAREAAAEQVEE